MKLISFWQQSNAFIQPIFDNTQNVFYFSYSLLPDYDLRHFIIIRISQ